jgi:hypothetical protein
MSKLRQVPTLQQSGAVLRLLSSKDLALFWFMAIARFAVNLLDIAGVALLAVAVNFLISEPNGKSPLASIFAFLGMSVDAKGSKLPALFTVGVAVVAIFLLKALMSLKLLAQTARQVSKLEIKYSVKWMIALTDAKGRFNARGVKEEIAYAVTAGSYSIFQRTLVPLGTVVSDSASLILTIVILALLQPVMTLGILVYFALVGLILQNYVGTRTRRNAQIYTESHVDAVRSVREAIENEKQLFLSGRKHVFVKRFEVLKTLSSQSQAQITLLSNYPRYVVESALIVGAFGLAGGAFAVQSPLAAATTLTFFLTSATRMTPSLLNVMAAVSIINGAMPDTLQTENLLESVNSTLGGDLND